MWLTNNNNWFMEDRRDLDITKWHETTNNQKRQWERESESLKNLHSNLQSSGHQPSKSSRTLSFSSSGILKCSLDMSKVKFSKRLAFDRMYLAASSPYILSITYQFNVLRGSKYSWTRFGGVHGISTCWSWNQQCIIHYIRSSNP